MLELITLLAIVATLEGYWIAELRRKLRDQNWKLPSHDAFHGDVFSGRDSR